MSMATIDNKGGGASIGNAQYERGTTEAIITLDHDVKSVIILTSTANTNELNRYTKLYVDGIEVTGLITFPLSQNYSSWGCGTRIYNPSSVIKKGSVLRATTSSNEYGIGIIA